MKVEPRQGSSWWRFALLGLLLSPAAVPEAMAGPPAVQTAPSDWKLEAFRELHGRYGTRPAPDPTQPDAYAEALNGVASAIGARLAREGASGVPPQDVALLALLLSSTPAAPQSTAPAPSPLPSVPAPASGAGQSTPPAPDPVTFADIGKGDEGFLQGVERLGEMPLSERLVITGDITSGIQAALVPDSNDLTSTFGRMRINVVARAVPGSRDGRLSEGYFFLQARAAGGPFDTNAVTGINSFSALNDVATDRSRFNEGTSRGNVYLSKAFYQQDLQVWEGKITGRIGIINLSDFFDTNEFANNEARQFLNASMVNSAGYKTGLSAPGLMGEYYRPLKSDWLRQAVFRVGYAVSRTERAFTSPVWSTEAEAQTLFRGRQGRWRLGGTVGNLADVGTLGGMHFSADQWVSDNIGVFGRYAYSNRGAGSQELGPVRQSYSFGAQWRFIDQDEHVSAWGVGFSQALPIQLLTPLSSERVLETYYRWQVTDKFSLSPDFQLILGSGGRRVFGIHPVVGVRMNFGL